MESKTLLWTRGDGGLTIASLFTLFFRAGCLPIVEAIAIWRSLRFAPVSILSIYPRIENDQALNAAAVAAAKRSR